jgi:bacillithiol biosynthesis deacetylase BshB1
LTVVNSPNVLAIVAHPDDASIFCGGTLAKHSARGDDVHVAHMTRGGYGGTAEEDEAALAERRTGEANEAAGVLGVETSFLGFKDGRIEYSLENRRRLNEAIREHGPDLLLTHDPNADHPDHRMTGQLVTDAHYQASLPMVNSDCDPVDPDNIYYFGKFSSDFDPDIFVDVTEQYEAKKEAIRCHESQVDFLENHGGLDRNFDDLIEEVRARDRCYGQKCGVTHAEGFQSIHTEPQDYLG